MYNTENTSSRCRNVSIPRSAQKVNYSYRQEASYSTTTGHIAYICASSNDRQHDEHEHMRLQHNARKKRHTALLTSYAPTALLRLHKPRLLLLLLKCSMLSLQPISICKYICIYHTAITANQKIHDVAMPAGTGGKCKRHRQTHLFSLLRFA